MAHRAAEIVLELLRGSGVRPKQTRIDLGFEINARGSTAPRRRAGLGKPQRAPRGARVEAK